MKINNTDINGVLLIDFPKFEDNRGYFLESYNKNTFENLGIFDVFVQDNISVSKKNVIRGMHGQHSPNQAKLVRCISGCIYDVALDIRKNSPTFMKYVGFELSKENNRALLIPHGCLHGFVVKSEEDAIVLYKTTGVYNKTTEYGVNPLSCDINWEISDDDIVISERDKSSQNIDEFLKSDIYQAILNLSLL